MAPDNEPRKTPSATPPAAENAAVGQKPSEEAAWTVGRVLDWTMQHLKKHGSDTPRLDAEVLLAHARQCPRIQLYASYHDPLPTAVRDKMRDLVRRRALAEPVAYLVGYREFYSLRFAVNASVLIPRPATETLVLELLTRSKLLDAPRVLDLCTGSGAIAVTIAHHAPRATVLATDASDAALVVASENARTHGVAERVTFRAGDLFDAVPVGETFDFLASNPPYVCDSEWSQLPATIRDHEPRQALLAGADGLDIVRRLVARAHEFVRSGGWFLCEVDSSQIAPTRALLEATEAWEPPLVVKDADGHDRVILARRKA